MIPLPEGKKYHVFLAHSGKDTETAAEIKRLLGEAVSVFLDCESLSPGDTWDTEIPKAQQESLTTVILISRSIELSFYQQEEVAGAIALARESEHRVIPVYLNKSGAPVPYGLRRLHSIYLKKERSLGAVAEKIITIVRKIAGEERNAPYVAPKRSLWAWRKATWIYLAMLALTLALPAFVRVYQELGPPGTKTTSDQQFGRARKEIITGSSHLVFGESKNSYRIDVTVDARRQEALYIEGITVGIFREIEELMFFSDVPRPLQYDIQPISVEPEVKSLAMLDGSPAPDKVLRFEGQVTFQGTPMEDYRVSATGQAAGDTLSISFPASIYLDSKIVHHIYIEIPKKFRGRNVALLNTTIGRLAWGNKIERRLATSSSSSLFVILKTERAEFLAFIAL